MALLLNETLGNLQRSERLARTAGHDELPAVTSLEPLHRSVHRFVLMRAQLLLLVQPRRGAERGRPRSAPRRGCTKVTAC